MTDSLQVYVGGVHYIPFNLADLGILAGAACLIFSVLSQLRVSSDTAHRTFRVEAQ